MRVVIQSVKMGPLEVLGYGVGCPETGEALLIDPAAPSAEMSQWLREGHFKVRWIVNTHGHADHTAGNEYWAGETGGAVVMHERDWHFFSTPGMQAAARQEGFPPLRHVDRLVQDGDRLALGKGEATVIHTPGHTPGGICLYVPGHLFTGDTLFVGAAGRTDLPGGSLPELLASLESKIMPLPEETIVWPGHDYGDQPHSTVGEEKRSNPYLTDFF